MTFEMGLGGAVALLLIAYLFHVLIKPENY